MHDIADADNTAGFGDGLGFLVGDLYQRLALYEALQILVGRDDRSFRDLGGMKHSVAREMRDTDHHAEAVHFLDHRHAELRELAAHFVDTAAIGELVASVVS